jgi:cytochrome b involved in lipid metabolism
MSATEGVAKEMKEFTWDEVAQHKTEDDVWMVVENKVYDFTSFLGDHPGGKRVRCTGQSACLLF